MIFSMAFVICFVFSYIQLLITSKKQHKISIIHSMIICFITQICIGAVIAQILSFLSLQIDLKSMSVVFLGLGIVLSIWNIKTKTLQKYTVNAIEIFSVFIIVIGFGCVFLLVFTPNIVLAYQNSDPAVHFNWAMQIVKTGRLSTMYFASLFNALFIEIGKPFIAEINCYKLFILADSVANLLNAFMFYCIADKLCKSKFVKICLPFLSLLYFMGWPFFNYVIGGFVYFGWGITLIAYVLYLLFALNECTEKRQQVILWILIFIGCFCTVVCYMLFVPTLVAIVLFGIGDFLKKNGIRVNKVKLCMGIGIILIMGGIAFCIAFFGFFGGDAGRIFRSLRIDGWIQNEPYKDFLYLFPVAIYMLAMHYKERKNNILYIAFTVVIVYIAITFIGSLMGMISAYYFYKEYYVLWILCWLICIDGMEYMLVRDKILVYVYTGITVFLSIITLLGVDTSTTLRERGLIPSEVVSGENPAALSIYGRAHTFIVQDREEELKDKNAFIDVSQYLRSYEAEKTSIMLTSSNYMGKWFLPFGGGERIWINTRGGFEEALGEAEKEKIDFIVVHENTELYRNNSDLMDQFERIYDNGYYGVYKNGITKYGKK